MSRRPTRTPLTLHTRLTLLTTGVLLVVGTVAIVAIEWSATAFASLSAPDKVLAGFFQSVRTRTAGFSSVDIGALPHPARPFSSD